MEYLSTTYGLVTDTDPTTENGQLFLAMLIMLQLQKNDPASAQSIPVMQQQMWNSWTGIRGLYHRNPDLIDRRIMSHDNMSGIMSFYYLTDNGTRFEIWNYLLKYLGTYDNSRGVTKQWSRFLPFNPSNFFIWGLAAKSKIYLAFLPIFAPSLWLACRRPVEDTSGKILAWVEMSPHKNHWLVKHLFGYYEKKMKAQYGEEYLKALIVRYHGANQPEFPLLKIVNE